MSERLHLAIDLGAGSGRAVLGRIQQSGLLMRETHRFHYPPRRVDGHLRWNFATLIDGVRAGIRSAQSTAASLGGAIDTLGVDSWGVDYGLLDESGRLIEDPVCYRDERTANIMDDVFARATREEIFARTGIQLLAINTLFQLAAHVREGFSPRATRLLLIPDLCHHALCGSVVTERTNASTTQLLNGAFGSWDASLLERLSIPRAVMPAVVAAGTELGTLREGAIRVVAPATHDTASAVAGTPLSPGWAYISSGTWSLVGVEREAPLVNDRVARANFTNEAGACGTIRFLKNVMGLWILDACRREWNAAGIRNDLAPLLEKVAAVGGSAGVVYPDDPRFFNPSSMTHALRGALEDSGQSAPDDPVLLAKIILDSLALRYASVLTTIEALTGRPVPGIHIVGGGAMNEYLNQAIADAAGRPVVAGPVEATAAGNLLIQALSCGELSSLAEGRHVLAKGAALRPYAPRSAAAWVEAAKRYQDIEGQAAA